MVLKQNMSFVPFAKIGPVPIFTVCDQSSESRSSSFVFQHFISIEPMLHVITMHHDPATVPISNSVKGFGPMGYRKIGSRDQIVQRSQRPVSLDPFFSIRVNLIVKDLILQSDGGSRPFVQIGIDEILHTRI